MCASIETKLVINFFSCISSYFNECCV